MAQWNPWHGCRKISDGCANCYVYRMDAAHDKDASKVTKNSAFRLPIARRRDGSWKIPSGETLYTCFSSDFFLDEADSWRAEAWDMIRQRQDLDFFIITKRIDRFRAELPGDWGDGYPNVMICSTCENQDRANFRLPILCDLPIRRKGIICEPLLGPIDLLEWLPRGIESVLVGGESGSSARICDFSWVQGIRDQCVECGVRFHFKQTGAKFVKDGKLYRIKRKDQFSQARKAGIEFHGTSKLAKTPKRSETIRNQSNGQLF